MSVTCAKCSSVISNDKESISCADCKNVFHAVCTKISTLENLKKMGSRKQNWKCEDCKVETGSSASGSDLSGKSNPVLEAVLKMREDMTAKLDANYERLNTLGEDLASVKTDMGSLKADVNSIKENNVKLAAEFASLKEENVALKKEVRELQSTVQHLDQYSRVNNLIITGIPVTAKEDVTAILASVAEVIGVEFHSYDVSAAHRLKSFSNDQRPPPIVAQFISRYVKNSWLAARRHKKGLKTSELRGKLPGGDVYINEHLTQHTRATFNRARAMVKSGKLHQVWTADCKVFVRKVQNGRAVRINSIQDLEE